MSIYGVEWNIDDTTTTVTRVGDPALHNATTGLPIQNKIKRCLLLDNGNVNYYLNPTNSLQKEDTTSSILDGTDGQVMVEIPEYYIFFQSKNRRKRVMISEQPFKNAIKIPKTYVSAFEATVQRSTNKLSSVINTTTDYRGGNNNATLDGQLASQLGMPATLISRINFTTFARNRGLLWDQYLYNVHKSIWWLYLIEYAERNSQAGFNGTLTPEGYRQGGLGTGVTNINATNWGTFNGSYPIITCGSGSMDNTTSSTVVVHPVLGSTQVPQYRGIEHPFGHINKWTEGINVRAFSNKILMYKSNTRDYSSVNYDNYTYVSQLPILTGFIRDIIFGADGDILPTVVSGSGTTYYSDLYFQTTLTSGEELRGIRFGGSSFNSNGSGLLMSLLSVAPFGQVTNIGSRLCFVQSA